MGIISLLWPGLNILMLTLHFYRNSNSVAMLLCCILLLAFAVRRPWAFRLLQICLILGAAEWGRTMFVLIDSRIEAGIPFLRLTFILGCVILWNLASLLVFRTAKVRHYFKEVAIMSDEQKKQADI